MKHNAEKILLLIGACWNIFTALLTIFGYSDWLKKEGTQAFSSANQIDYFSVSLVDSLVNVVMIFGLFMLVTGIVTLFAVRFLNDELLNKKILVWLIFCVVIQFFSFDLIGVFLYLAAVIIYIARNQAYKKVIKNN